MAEKRSELTRNEERGIAHREPSSGVPGSFHMLERFADEMDRLFSDFGFGRGWPSLHLGRSPWRSSVLSDWQQAWAPQIDVFQRNNELVVHADLPGLTKDDVKVDVTDDIITIQGERKREHEEERDGVYRSERSHGSFYRVIPLPDGAMTDQAKASFKDGVLEITMPAPPEQVRRGRRIEISGEGRKAEKPESGRTTM